MPIKRFKEIAEKMESTEFIPLPKNSITGDDFELWLTKENNSNEDNINMEVIMSVKDQFIKDLINKLNDINESREKKLNICYLVSVIDQQIEKCTEFIYAISEYQYYIEEDCTNRYTQGRIKVFIEDIDDDYYKFCYNIEFTYDERLWGYCQCTPNDEEYNAEHDCCGCGCDWYATAFRITKEIDLGNFAWDGYEKDYWQYEKEFKLKQSDIAEELERLEKEKLKQSIEDQIAELQERLKQL